MPDRSGPSNPAIPLRPKGWTLRCGAAECGAACEAALTLSPRRSELPSPPHSRHRRALGLALLLLLALLLAGGWWYGAGRFGDSIDGWIAARRAEGWRIDTSGRRITGFPLGWTARFATLAIAAPVAPWSWQASAVTISWSPFDRNGLALGTSGSARLDIIADGAARTIRIDSSATAVRLDLAAQPLQHATGTATHIAVSMPELDAAAETLGFEVTFDPAAPADHTANAATLALAAEQLQLTPHDRPPPPPLSGSLTATLKGMPPSGPPQQAVAAWRDEGGTIELDRLDVKSGAMAVAGNATIALDGEMRPLAAGTASISGIDALLERLVASGQMQARDVPLAKLAFGALAKPDPATGVATVTLPVTAENGILYLGPIKVAALKPIRLD